jgi:4-hydroxy-tetrahydrodipicolinate reductase
MNVAIVGAAGRMGGRLIQAVVAADGLELVGATERPGHPQIGADAGMLAAVGELGIKISDDLEATLLLSVLPVEWAVA